MNDIHHQRTREEKAQLYARVRMAHAKDPDLSKTALAERFGITGTKVALILAGK
jgi:hypothetical protein